MSTTQQPKDVSITDKVLFQIASKDIQELLVPQNVIDVKIENQWYPCMILQNNQKKDGTVLLTYLLTYLLCSE